MAGTGQAEGEAVLAALILAERDTKWFSGASCARVFALTGIDYWFRSGSEPFVLKEKMGKFICSRCPVKAACLNDAIVHEWEDGIWGGLGPDERKLLKPAALREVLCLAA